MPEPPLTSDHAEITDTRVAPGDAKARRLSRSTTRMRMGSDAAAAHGVQTQDAKEHAIFDRVAGRRSSNDRGGLPFIGFILAEMALVLGSFIWFSIPFQVVFFATKLLLPIFLDDTSVPERFVAYIGVIYAAWLGIRFLLPAQHDLWRLRGRRDENAPYVRFSDMVAVVALRRVRFICEAKHFLSRFHA